MKRFYASDFEEHSNDFGFQTEGLFFMAGADSYYQNESLRYFQEGYQKQAEGNIDEAIQLYHQSIELYPTAEAHTFLGWAFSFQGRFDDAIAECKKAIEIDPEYGNPYNDIGSYLIEKGLWDDALPWLEKATSAKRYESYCYPYYNLGRIWEKKGEWYKALECYQNSIKDNPDYTLARRALGRLQGFFN